MAKIIIGLVGEMASGKGAVSEYIKEKYNGDSFRFSDTFRKVLDILGIEQSRENISELSMILRKSFGEDILARAIAENAKKSPADIVVLDGVRREEDLKYLKELPEFKLIFIETNIETRYKRMVIRGENDGDNTKTFEEFKKEHEMDADARIVGLKEIADEVIDNNGTIEDLYRQVDEFIG